MLARQAAVDAHDQTIPIAQHVEGHDRRDEDQGQDVDEREAAAEHRPERAADPLHDAAGLGAEGRFEIGHLLGRQMFIGQFQQRLRPRHQRGGQRRQAGDESDDLRLDERNEQQQDDDQKDAEPDEDDRGRQGPSAAPLLQAVAERIEKIGERQAGDERQQDGAQEIERDQRQQEADEPEAILPLRGHRVSCVRKMRHPQIVTWAPPDSAVVAATMATMASMMP